MAVIGHEVSHGFDDSGSKFGPDGNLKSWWTPEDRAKFEERAACVVSQFNGYEVQPGLNINGRLTLGENIGDLGGLNVAYTALMNSMKGSRNRQRSTALRRSSVSSSAGHRSGQQRHARGGARFRYWATHTRRRNGVWTARCRTCRNLPRRGGAKQGTRWSAKSFARSGKRNAGNLAEHL